MKNLILVLFLLTVLSVEAPAAATTNHYTCPPNVNLSLVTLPTQEAGTLRLCASIEALVGSPTLVDLFFESSVDLVVMPARTLLKTLARGEKKEYVLDVKPSGKAGDASGTWIRLRAVYLPDYHEVVRIIANPREYTDRNEQQRLLKRVLENRKTKARQTDVTRHFPQNFPPKPR